MHSASGKNLPITEFRTNPLRFAAILAGTTIALYVLYAGVDMLLLAFLGILVSTLLRAGAGLLRRVLPVGEPYRERTCITRIWRY